MPFYWNNIIAADRWRERGLSFHHDPSDIFFNKFNTSKLMLDTGTRGKGEHFIKFDKCQSRWLLSHSSWKTAARGYLMIRPGAQSSGWTWSGLMNHFFTTSCQQWLPSCWRTGVGRRCILWMAEWVCVCVCVCVWVASKGNASHQHALWDAGKPLVAV